MLDLQGQQLSDEECHLLQHPQVGGVILFSRNIASPAQVLSLTAAIRALNPQLLLAVDQEGGRVQRLKEGFTRLPPMQCFGRLWWHDAATAVELARDTGWLMASEVLACGLDFSFAPVLDLYTGRSAVIGDRAFADDIDVLIALATAFMQGMRQAGMATTGKHFPGHGSVEADSHLELPVDSRPLAQIRERDMLPFVRCMPEMDAVMPAHVIYDAADAHCAGFSKFWLQQVLRQELKFDGVIFSDDLVMAAAAAAGDMTGRARQALAAGCDMLLVCNDRNAARQVLDVLVSDAVPGNPRLQRMRKRHTADFNELKEMPRWQRTRTALATL